MDTIPRRKEEESHMYVYGAPLMGSAAASSSMMGRQRKRTSVAMNSAIGELAYEKYKSVHNPQLK